MLCYTKDLIEKCSNNLYIIQNLINNSILVIYHVWSVGFILLIKSKRESIFFKLLMQSHCSSLRGLNSMANSRANSSNYCLKRIILYKEVMCILSHLWRLLLQGRIVTGSERDGHWWESSCSECSPPPQTYLAHLVWRLKCMWYRTFSMW